jgi:hypothetical protein
VRQASCPQAALQRHARIFTLGNEPAESRLQPGLAAPQSSIAATKGWSGRVGDGRPGGRPRARGPAPPNRRELSVILLAKHDYARNVVTDGLVSIGNPHTWLQRACLQMPIVVLNVQITSAEKSDEKTSIQLLHA